MIDRIDQGGPAAGRSESGGVDRGLEAGHSSKDSSTRTAPKTTAPTRIAPKVIASKRIGADDESTPETFKTWSREEAQAWRQNNPSVSPWRVVAVQAVAGLVCCAAVWALTQRSEAAWSALYGAVAVVMPSALLARGMTRGVGNPMAAAAGFLFWEMLKIGVAIGMLVIASRVVPHLSWPALLVTMVVCMKVNWFALLWRAR